MIKRLPPRAASGIAAAVDVARAALKSAPSSTQAWSQILKLSQDDFQVPGFDTLAARLEGTAPKPGPDEIDDTAALKRVDELAPRHGCAAVGIVAGLIAPGDPTLQETIAHRLRRKLREKRTH